MKYVRFALPIALALSCAPFAAAQSGVDVNFGVGTAQVGSSGQSIDTFGDGNLYNTPHMGGTFLNFGAAVMLTPHYGVGGELSFKPSQSNYAGLNYRPMFYDFNGIWQPAQLANKRIVPELQAGVGGVSLRYYYNQQYCDAFTGCSSSNSFLESSNHFQFHMGGGVRFYISHNLFVRPVVDAHWVNNFYQFGSNWVPEYRVDVGYHFGER